MYNFITIDNCLTLLPFPKEIQEIIESLSLTIDFSKFKWNSYGFPIDGGTYNLIGKTLYFESYDDGSFDVKRVELSGNVSIGAYFINPNKELNNYSVAFNLLFLKGELVEVVLLKLEPQDPKVFEQLSLNLKTQLNKINERQKSFWYKKIYFPYAYCVRIFINVLLVITDLTYRFLRWLAFKLTPF